MLRSVTFAIFLSVALGLVAYPTRAAAAHQHVPKHSQAHATKPAHTAPIHKQPAHIHNQVHVPPHTTPHVAAHGHVKPALSPRMKATARSPYKSKSVKRALWRKRDRMQPNPPARLETVRLAMPPPMRGSYESLVHQNVMASADGLERIQDDEDLQDRIDHGSLVRVPVSSSLRINNDLPENRRYCRPWTARFLSDLSQAHAGKFGGDLEVTSAVRTVEYQRKLRHVNGNAAAADGDIASPHLTGGTIDIAKQGLTAREIGWLRSWLTPLEQAGLIDVEEEFKQACFHISVYKSYSAPKGPRKTLPSLTSPLAAASILGVSGR